MSISTILAIILVIAVVGIGLKVLNKKKHGGHGCIHDCANCSNPCHHKGRF